VYGDTSKLAVFEYNITAPLVKVKNYQVLLLLDSATIRHHPHFRFRNFERFISTIC